MTPAAQTSDDFEEMLAGLDRIIHDKELQQQLLDAGLLVRIDKSPASAAQTSEPRTVAGRQLLDLLEADSARPFLRDVMVSNILDIEAEAQRLTVERLTPWLIHGLDASGHQCGFYTAEPCDCGLRAALAREETGA